MYALEDYHGRKNRNILISKEEIEEKLQKLAKNFKRL